MNEAQFSENIPQYVEQARVLSAAIIDRGLDDSNSGIKLSAEVPYIGLGEKTVMEVFRDNMVPHRWHGERRGVVFNADARFESGMLALKYKEEGLIEAWTYSLPPDLEREFRGEEVPEPTPAMYAQLETVREDSRNLLTPAFSFSDSFNDPRIGVGLCNALGRHNLNAFLGIMNVPLERYRSASAPRFSKEDVQAAEQGESAFRAYKIEGILRTMSIVVGREESA